MNRPDVQHSAQSAERNQDHAAASTQIAAGSPPSIPAHKSEGEPNQHVCTDEGATNGRVITAEKSDAKVASGAAKTGGNETVSMGSPAYGLGGRPVPKDAIHNNT